MQGTFAVDATTLTLNGAASNTGGALTSLPSGTVFYNQASAGQSLLLADYGHLQLNAFGKHFQRSVGVASSLTVPIPQQHIS